MTPRDDTYGGLMILPVKIKHWNTPMGDSGDFEGHTAIVDANGEGEIIFEWFDADDDTEKLAGELVERLNRSAPSAIAPVDTRTQLEKNQGAIALLDEWIKESAEWRKNATPEEIKREEDSFNELMRSIDGNRGVQAAQGASDEWPGWRPMEHAPRGQYLLGSVGGQVRVIAWGKTSHVPIYGWCLADQGGEDRDICEPDGWMKLPVPMNTTKEPK